MEQAVGERGARCSPKRSLLTIIAVRRHGYPRHEEKRILSLPTWTTANGRACGLVTLVNQQHERALQHQADGEVLEGTSANEAQWWDCSRVANCKQWPLNPYISTPYLYHCEVRNTVCTSLTISFSTAAAICDP